MTHAIKILQCGRPVTPVCFAVRQGKNPLNIIDGI